MEPQMTHAQGHHYDQNPLNQTGGVVEGEEKKSIFSRVKDKAKKVKTSITNRAQGGHDQDQDDVEHDQDHEEIVQDPGMHGAPAAGSDVNSTKTSPGPTPAEFQTKVTDFNSMHEPAPPKTTATGSDVNSTNASPGPTPAEFQTKVTDFNSMHEPAPPKTKATGSDVNSTNASPGPTPAEFQTKITDFNSMHEPAPPKTMATGPDVNLNPSATQTPSEKVTDSDSSVPAPSAYDSVAPWDASFDQDAKSGPNGTLPEKLKETNMPKGTLGDKFGVDSDVVTHRKGDVPPMSQQAKISEPLSDHGVNSGIHESVGKPPNEDVFLDSHEPPSEDVPPANYLAKGADVGANVSGHDAGASPTDAGDTPIVHSLNKMAIHDEPEHKKESVTAGSHDHHSLSPIMEKNESNGAANDQNHPQDMNVDEPNSQQEADLPVSDNAISAKNDATSENVGNTDVSGLESPKQKQSTYTDMVSSATTAVASKFGYGGTDNAPVQESELNKEDGGNVQSDAAVSGLEPPKPQKSGSEMDKADSANAQAGGEDTGYAKQIGSTVTGAGSAILSKIPGTGMGNQQKTSEDVDIGATHEGATDDMGMGESEEKKGAHEAVKDTVQKRNTDEDMDREKTNVPMGKVTESEEVANRLGSSEEDRTGKVPGTGNESPSTGVVDKFKGAFTNWFGKGGETNPSMAFNDQSTDAKGPTGEEDNVSREGERRLQAN